MDAPSTLDERYGRTPAARRANRWIIIGASVAFGLVFLFWLVWAGFGGPSAQFQARDTGFELHGERSVTVQWRFTVDPGTPAHCAVQALNSSFGIVGWKVVEIPASDRGTRLLSATLLTAEPAVTGLIYRCWLA